MIWHLLTFCLVDHLAELFRALQYRVVRILENVSHESTVESTKFLVVSWIYVYLCVLFVLNRVICRFVTFGYRTNSLLLYVLLFGVIESFLIC